MTVIDKLYADVAILQYMDLRENERRGRAVLVALEREVKAGDFFNCDGLLLQINYRGRACGGYIINLGADCISESPNEDFQTALLLKFTSGPS